MSTEPMTVREAARRLGISKSRTYRMIEQGHLRVVDRTGQPRQSGRYASGGFLLNAEDVEREAASRGR